VISLLAGLADSWALRVVLGFVALYPMVTAAVWVVTALLYWRSREGADDSFYDLADAELPRVSVLVPAYREAAVLDATLEVLHVLDYPDYEVVVVDDGSPDDTAEVARGHARRPPWPSCSSPGWSPVGAASSCWCLCCRLPSRALCPSLVKRMAERQPAVSRSWLRRSSSPRRRARPSSSRGTPPRAVSPRRG